MKFIGQYIQSFIARFRNDVFLEDVGSGTIASGGNLGLDSNNKIVKADVPAGDINQVSFTSDSGSFGITTGDADFTISGGEGINTSISTSTITIAGEDASTSNKGIAEFSDSHFSVASGKVTLADTITGNKIIQGNLRIGGPSDTSNNWISIDAQGGNDSSGGGITFFETNTTDGSHSFNAPQYGAKIVYNEDDDELAIGTMHNNTFMRQIHMDRSSSQVLMQNIKLQHDSTNGPYVFFLKTDTSVADGDSLARIIVRNSDRGTSTNNSQIQWFATEDHDSNSCGTKMTFTVTPNGNSQSETTAMTIDQDSTVTVAGALQPNTIELGHASDTTIARSAAGKVTIEGSPVQTTQMVVTTHNFQLANTTGTFFYIPFNNLNESSAGGTSNYWTRTVPPYAGTIKKIAVRSHTSLGTSCELRISKITDTTDALTGGTHVDNTSIDISSANVSVIETMSTNSFAAGDAVGVALKRSAGTAARVVMTIAWEYTT